MTHFGRPWGTRGAVIIEQGECVCDPFYLRHRMCRRWSWRNDSRAASAGVVLLSWISFQSTAEALASLAALPPPTYAATSLSQPTSPILCSSLMVADSAAAKSPLFQANPLTNGILEQVRIWEQAEADNIRYGGELERGDAGNKGQVSAYPKLLVPILRMARELQGVETALQNKNADAPLPVYNQLVVILNQPSYDKIAFKRVFNAFADNIYYSDPDRANLYLGGGALPKTEQSLAYLLRNEILGNVEDLRAELTYLIKVVQDDNNEAKTEAMDDARRYASQANNAMQRYLQIVSPKELQAAQELLSES